MKKIEYRKPDRKERGDIYHILIDALSLDKFLDDDTVKIEALKINFLSAFREAYKYLDPNTPEKNIIPAGSSYLYTLNSIQALRKEISDMKNSAYGTKLEYLNSMEDYADYWYNNLRDWTEISHR